MRMGCTWFSKMKITDDFTSYFYSERGRSTTDHEYKQFWKNAVNS